MKIPQLESMPASFVMARIEPSFQDLEYGYRMGFLGWKPVVEISTSIAERQEKFSTALIDLISVDRPKPGEVSRLLREIAASERPLASDDLLSRRWLYLTMAWLYANRHNVSNPLETVDWVYAEFDYPEEVASFVYYMPDDATFDLTEHCDLTPIDRLMQRWAYYLRMRSAEFGPQAEAGE